MSKAPTRRKTDSGKNTSSSPTVPSDSFPRWTLLTNHAHVLAVLHSDPEIVLRQVAIQVGITERAVQRIIQDLEEADPFSGRGWDAAIGITFLPPNPPAIRLKHTDGLVTC